MRTTHIYRDGKWIDKRAAQEEREAAEHVHNVIEDSMQPLKHPVDGHIYDSKSEFRRITRMSGRVEVGNDEQKSFRVDNRPPVRESLKAAIDVLDTLEGKSEGDRREIHARFCGDPYFDEHVVERYKDGF